jgi:hypothetical protein
MEPSPCSLCKINPATEGDNPFFRVCEECSSFNIQAPHYPVTIGSFLVDSIPFHVGERVECRTGAVWRDGVGVIDEIDYAFKHGGTPVYPTFHVVIDEPVNEDSPSEAWYTEVCLQRVSDSV